MIALVLIRGAAMEFGYIDLWSYVTAADELDNLEDEYLEERESLISTAFRQTEIMGGDIFYFTKTTEDIALKLADLSMKYEKRAKKLRRKAKQYRKGIELLTEEERRVFIMEMVGGTTRVHTPEQMDVYESAKEKLFSYLSGEKENHLSALKQQHKDAPKKTI